jgi:superfamily II DNA or RNA helicase
MVKSLQQQLREIFSGKLSVSQSDLSKFQEALRSKADVWRDDVEEIKSMFPDKIQRRQAGYLQFRLTGVYQDMITGACRTSNEEFQLYLDRNHECPVGCSCKESSGELPCVHGYQFTRFISQQLRNNAAISRRINGDQLDQNPPDHGHFVSDPLAEHKLLLTVALRTIGNLNASNSEQSVELAVAAPVVAGRIVWNFSVQPNRYFEVCPVFQMPKKRGGGWNKGKGIPLERLSEHAAILSPGDLRVCGKIVYDSYYEDELDPLDAAFELIGEPNVLINEKPGSIEAGNLRVTFEDNESNCTLRVGQLNNQRGLYSKGYLELDGTENVLSVCRLTETQSACARAILKMPVFPVAMRDDVIALARQVQAHLTVSLPADVAGPTVQDTARPLLLLLLDEKGVLSYGNRVRLTSGRVAKPGQGVLVVSQTQDGKPVQLARCQRDEMRLWEDLNQKIGLPNIGAEGSINDFEAVLQVLQKVSELEQGELQLEVMWDQRSQKPLRLLGNVTPQNLRVGVQKSRDWLQLNGECDFGNDQKMELSTLLHSLRNLDASSIQGNYVKLGEHGWAKISESLRKQLTRLDNSVNEDRKKLVFDASSAQVVQDLSKLQIQVDGTSAWTQCLERIERSKNINPQLPNGLSAQLRDYQRDGYCWMRRLAEWGVGGVLADDMGLGKTLQTLAVLLDRKDSGPALVVAPTSVGFNWVREVEKFTPELRSHLYRETDRADFLSSVGPGDIVVCSYGLALRDAEILAKTQWGTLVLDEAQAIKNARSKTATAISEINAQWKIALTGTPVENHLGELWSIFHAVAPGVFGGWEQFRKRFAAPIEKDGDEERRLALRERIQPFVLRRTKQAVLKDLPARTEMNLYVDLSPAEREAYDRVRLSAIGELDDIAKLSDIQDQRFKMLALLTRLRQLSCSPKLVHEDWLGRSAKLQLLAETIGELRQEGHRALIFSQFVTHLQLIREMLLEEGISFEYLDGSTTPTERQKRVDQFQSGQSDVFLISLKAGGTGLNLTAADYVIHTDPWWNPAVEDQATDRAHRIGQDKPVMVYRLISKGTIEEEILKLHDSKRDLVAGVLDGSHTAAKLSTSDLIELIRG